MESSVLKKKKKNDNNKSHFVVQAMLFYQYQRKEFNFSQLTTFIQACRQY